jgi:flagella synthesis protein FlgN
VDPVVVAEHLSGLLADEARLLAQLEHLLEAEAEALRSDDLSAIERAGGERQKCTNELLRLDQERLETCRMLGYAPDRHGFGKLLTDCDGRGELTRCWRATLDVLARCRDANDRNGAVVTAKLRRIEGLLATLRGGDAVPQIYGAGGTRDVAARSLTLGRA